MERAETQCDVVASPAATRQRRSDALVFDAPARIGQAPSTEFPERILVVEDDPTIRLMLEHAFSKAAKVFIAENGAEGLDLIASEEPDFVVTDLQLPVMDGLTMITQVRRTYVGACTPILVMTSSTEEQALLASFREGADDFMVKPFSISELRVRVSSIYVRQKLARDMNPLTRLPGNLVTKREIESRLGSKEPFAVAYIDLDNFKPFNDAKGFDQGDEAIKLVAEILRGYAGSRARGEVFIGHIGGDDFILILGLNEIKAMAEHVFARFEHAARRFYSAEQITKGTVTMKNRKGEMEEVPLLSMSIGALKCDGHVDARKIGEVAAEVKKVAKGMPGNSLFIDRWKRPR